jgi:uncharacterized protein (DUF4415 family)
MLLLTSSELDRLSVYEKRICDFSQGQRGPVAPEQPGKTRITIRIDTDILNWFRDQVNSPAAAATTRP